MMNRSSAAEQWAALVERFSHMTDGLGKPIDGPILETVVALNALGIPTAQSCGGHFGQGDHLRFPWVDITSADPALLPLQQEEERLVEEVKKQYARVPTLSASQLGEPQEEPHTRQELQATTTHLREVQWQIRLLLAGPRAHLARLLAQFYTQEHETRFDRRLVLARTRMQSQGAYDLYLTAPAPVQRRKLGDYRAEMAAFARWLKRHVLAGGDPGSVLEKEEDEW